jgi:hypothetical protein
MLWRGRTCIVAALLALVLPPATASAETGITAQAVADGGAFLPYAPAPAQLDGMCLVDTGVNLNPDTEGVVVERAALDGGSGNDVSSTLHGTVLAMMAGAPANGWGMVGTAPRAIQIVSVRILEPGQTTFPFSAYATGIDACLSVRSHYNVRVINLSLGTSEVPSGRDYEMLANAVQEASNYGVAVVAAAGNDDGGAVEYPAAYPGVLSDAHRLREWMHNRDSSTEDGQAPPLVPSHIPPGTLFAESDEHLLYFMRLGGDDTYVNVFLFGCSYFAVPVDTTGAPVPPQAWRLDWRKPSKDGSTTWNDLLNDAVRRRIQAAIAVSPGATAMSV